MGFRGFSVNSAIAMFQRALNMASRFLGAVATLGSLILAGSDEGWAVHASVQRESDVPVLVELFTSEGCSSCPPADEVLIRLDEQQPVTGVQVVVVSEHVDYWNGLGWRDPFSSVNYTQRQDEFRKALGEPASYTPQMVVDGRTALVGSLRAEVHEAIAVAAGRRKTVLQLQVSGPESREEVTVEVEVADLPRLSDGQTVELWFVVTESGLTSNVSRGENARRRLRHAAVARRFELVETLPAVLPVRYHATITVAIDPTWDRHRLRGVAFLQEAVSRAVVGVAQISLIP